MVDSEEVMDEYGIELNNTPSGEFDAIILAVDHEDYKHLSYYDHLKNGNKETLIFDVKGDKKDRFPCSIYMSL
jgi:UDP-N-acetyl-D-galactosamine dehydrogenase